MLRRRLLLAALAVGAAAVGGLLWSPGSASRRADDRAAVPVCAGTAAIDLACQRRRYAAIVRMAGIDAAFRSFKRAFAHEGFIRAGCHPIVHSIGHAAVARYGDDLAQLYARGDPFCSAGYFHGVTEQIVVDIGARRFLAAAKSMCADLGGRGRHTIYHRNCAHGIGHGFMLVLDGHLPRALETCDELADRWEQRSCYGGAFMQNVMELSRSRYLRPRDPLYPCADLPDRYRPMCFQKQTGYALYVRNGRFAPVFGLCARVDPAYRASCHEGLGTNIAVHHLKQLVVDRDLRRLTLRGCGLGRGREARVGCVAGAARALINYDHGATRALALCRAAEPGLRAGCLRTVRRKRAYPE